MVASTSNARKIIAFAMIAISIPTPISLMNVIPEVENVPITTTSSRAALTMIARAGPRLGVGAGR